MGSALAIIVFITAALILFISRQRILPHKNTTLPASTGSVVSRNQWTTTLQGEVAILAAGESHDIIEYGFVWGLIHKDAELASTRETLFEAKQLIIDFSLLKWAGHCSCEYHLLNQTYKTLKGKPIIFCGISPDLQFIFDTLGCTEIAPALFVLPTLKDALLHYEASKEFYPDSSNG
ncbi:hypothetical protein Q5H93_22385 [Hymenobacter sp. ASUV-10]|uniref:STAS domain-containing protein n=1 Tax=Hymenobacter aranciens TaxID=3063996 RepID=A0ABT9BGW4_9BACT|nr:hypothetical protein [Hymenobacter sp. ASUV-10]MDO7877504.1 hypothetical protein [Hymenobacter sp. ASUV-10]